MDRRKPTRKKPFLCDLITAWEVVEHMFPERLPKFFENVRKHLVIGGKFCGTISLLAGRHHYSIFPENIWNTELFPSFKGLKQVKYPFDVANAVRTDRTSFHFMVERVE